MNIDKSYTKPLACGATAAVIDRLYFRNGLIKSNLLFGGAVAAGTLVADAAMKYALKQQQAVPSLVKGLETRVIENGATLAGTFAVNKFVLNQTYMPQDNGPRALAVIASEIIGEYLDQTLF